MYLIFAPHVDDEIIGCFSLIKPPSSDGSLENSITVLYPAPVDSWRGAEALLCAEAFGYGVAFCGSQGHEFEASDSLCQSHGVFVAPDFHFETHPYHRAVGFKVWELARRMGKRFMSYTTRMNTPYVQTLSSDRSQDKRVVLEEWFPSQASLWKYDHRYHMFEGMSEWRIMS